MRLKKILCSILICVLILCGVSPISIIEANAVSNRYGRMIDISSDILDEELVGAWIWDRDSDSNSHSRPPIIYYLHADGSCDQCFWTPDNYDEDSYSNVIDSSDLSEGTGEMWYLDDNSIVFEDYDDFECVMISDITIRGLNNENGHTVITASGPSGSPCKLYAITDEAYETFIWTTGDYWIDFDFDNLTPCEGADENETMSWIWEKDNYSFLNSYDSFGKKGEPYYISDKDFTALLSKLNNTEIARAADIYGYLPALTPENTKGSKSIKLYNFLNKKLKMWGGSCYGMSLTAGLFKVDAKNPSMFNSTSTYSIPALNKNQNNSLESFINIYHVSQVCDNRFQTAKSSPVWDDDFSRFIDDFFDKALITEEPIMTGICEDTNGNHQYDDDDIGHAVLCYGAEYANDGSWNLNGHECNRRLLIADPNVTEETYIYISNDSNYAIYSEKEKYCIFEYQDCDISSLSSLDYNPKEIDKNYNIITSTRNNVIIVGHNPYCKVTIKDGNFTVDKESKDFFVDTIRMMNENDTEGAYENDTESFYRISRKSEYYEILPIEGEEIDTSLYLKNYSVDILGEANSAVINSVGDITLNGAKGETSVNLALNNSTFDFAQIEGNAKGKIEIKPDSKQLSIAGELSDYTVSNIDKNLNESKITIKGDKDIVLTIDKNHKLSEKTSSNTKAASAGAIARGKTYSIGGQKYTVTKLPTSTSAGEAALMAAKNSKKVSVPATVILKDGKAYKVTAVNAKAFKGKKIRTVTIGKNVLKIRKNAFKGSKATKMIVKTKLLKKATVKGSLKGSKVKTVQVKVGKKALNKKYAKKYKSIFTKKNAGRKVTVK